MIAKLSHSSLRLLECVLLLVFFVNPVRCDERVAAPLPNELGKVMILEYHLIEAEESHPDAIILDLRMPLVDGLSFLRRLRAKDAQRATPVAIVTGDYFLEDEVSSELRELGAELRFKPLWLEDLVGLARNLLGATH